MQNFQIPSLRNWCIGVSMAAVIASTPAAAIADRHEKALAPHLSFSIVCLESPEEDGWTDVTHHSSSISSARYGLLVNLPEKPNGPLPFSIEPYKYRLTVGAFPCFYEYSSHEYSGYGTALDVTVPTTHIEIDGMKFPHILDEIHAAPIIRGMIGECERSGFSWPYTFMIQSCERQISDTLVGETTSIRIHYDPIRPHVFETILFVRGLPYRDGKPLLQL